MKDVGQAPCVPEESNPLRQTQEHTRRHIGNVLKDIVCEPVRQCLLKYSRAIDQMKISQGHEIDQM